MDDYVFQVNRLAAVVIIKQVPTRHRGPHLGTAVIDHPGAFRCDEIIAVVAEAVKVGKLLFWKVVFLDSFY